jgi:hypothetical protein
MNCLDSLGFRGATFVRAIGREQIVVLVKRTEQ